MSVSVSLENLVESWMEHSLAAEAEGEELLSELRTLRAEAEAWRAVREEFVKPCRYPITRVVAEQIARLDAMKEGK